MVEEEKEKDISEDDEEQEDPSEEESELEEVIEEAESEIEIPEQFKQFVSQSPKKIIEFKAPVLERNEQHLQQENFNLEQEINSSPSVQQNENSRRGNYFTTNDNFDTPSQNQNEVIKYNAPVLRPKMMDIDNKRQEMIRPDFVDPTANLGNRNNMNPDLGEVRLMDFRDDRRILPGEEGRDRKYELR